MNAIHKTPGHQPCPPQRILVVEDDPDIRQLNSEVLIQHGYQVDTAEDGDAGWQMLRASHYDLLITDNNMPKVTGVDLIKKLRSASLTLPVILASGSAPANTELLQLAAILPKPFYTGQLLQTVRQVLQGDAGTCE